MTVALHAAGRPAPDAHALARPEGHEREAEMPAAKRSWPGRTRCRPHSAATARTAPAPVDGPSRRRYQTNRLTPALHERYSASDTQRACRPSGTPLGSAGAVSQPNSVTQNFTGAARDDPLLAHGGLQQLLHARQVAERDAVGMPRLVGRVAGRVRVMAPRVELHRRPAARDRLELLRQAQHLAHEAVRPDRERAGAVQREREQRRRPPPCCRRARGARRSRSGSTISRYRRGRVVAAVGVALREQEEARVRLVPGLEHPHPRKARDRAAVAARDRLAEQAELQRVGIARAGGAALVALGPRRRLLDR